MGSEGGITISLSGGVFKQFHASMRCSRNNLKERYR